MKWAFILGTRPEIIKFSPLVDEARRQGREFFTIHTGQHYDYGMDAVFFKELRLPAPRYALGIGSARAAPQLGAIVVKTDEILTREKPELAFVLGDTNTTLGGALAAAKCDGTKLVHIEAGCRSFNRRMPEESNRIVADHLADMLFAPTPTAVANLAREGLTQAVFLSGSTGIEACLRNAEIARKDEGKTLQEFNVKSGEYVVATIHRAENTTPASLQSIVGALNQLSERMPIVFPVHPRTRKALDENGIKTASGVMASGPVGYLRFLSLIANARMVLTDSGGAQEDCAALKVPCITLREETEWVETVQSGANVLAGISTAGIVKTAERLLENPADEARMRAAPSYWPEAPARTIIERLGEQTTW